MGRTRSVKWYPRNIDIDLLLYGDLIYADDEVTIPHPMMNKRGFVLYPLSDIAPDIIHPVECISVNDLRAQTGSEGIKKMVDLHLTTIDQ